MKKMRLIILFLLVSGIFSACVPAKKLEEQQAINAKLTAENNDLKSKLSDANAQLVQLSERINDVNDQMSALLADTASSGEKYRKSLSEVNALYDDAVQQNKLLLSKSSAERLALLDSLTKKQNEIRKKEEDLQAREQKLAELQSLLNRQDSATNALKQKIQQALLGFEKSDLTVEQKNGKVYVSLAEKLLFASGSIEVNPKGKTALQKLAEVLKKNPDISITVEGHTDNVPISTASIKDNWDLSVLRATTITRILTEYGVNPKQIISSGRGEYFPVAPNANPDGKAKNRRTEIILTPKLDELVKILGQ